MFDKILVAIDGSEHSKKALAYAIEVGQKFDGKITLIHVYSTAVPLVSPANSISAPALSSPSQAILAANVSEAALQRGKQILEEAENLAKKSGVSAEKVLREGDAVREIVSVAQEGNFRLIVMGHRGWGKIRELLMGAISEGVSHKAPCPVLIVK